MNEFRVSRIGFRVRGRRFSRLLMIPATAILLFAGLGTAIAGSSGEARLQAALDGALADLRAEEDGLRADTNRLDASEKEEHKRIESLLSACDALAGKIENAESELAAVRQEAAGARAEREKARSEEAKLREFVFEKVKSLYGKIALGVPHARRPSRLSHLRTLEMTSASPDADLEDLTARYVDAFLEEVRFGASCEVYSTGVITGEGNIREADCLRFGKIYGAYRTRDGNHAAVSVPGIGEEGGYEWRESDRAREAVDTALAGEGGIHLVHLDVTRDIAVDRMAVSKDLLTTLVSGGLVMIPLALVALGALVLIVERIVFLSLARPNSTRIEREVLARVRAGDVDAAREACSRIRGPAASALLAGLSAHPSGKSAVEEAVEEAAVRALPGLERFLPAIGALAAIAPLLGLLGTVTGMISTFDVITLFGTGDPRLLSGGISEALITTQIGLIIAIPLLLIHRALSGAVERRVSAMETLGVSLVNAMFHAGPVAATEVERGET